MVSGLRLLTKHHPRLNAKVKVAKKEKSKRPKTFLLERKLAATLALREM